MIEVIIDEPRSGEPIVDALRELVLAHRVVHVDDAPSPPLPADLTLPAIRDGARVVAGEANLTAYLGELAVLAAAWSRFQSDTCYLDDDGTVC